MIIWSSEHSDNFTHNRLTGKGCAYGTSGMHVDVIAETGLEPLTLDEAKEYMSIDYPDWDNVIQAILIPAARKQAEKYTNRSFRPQTLKVSWAKTVGYIDLPYTPVNSIVTVLDKDGAALSYETDHQGRVNLPYGAIVTYTAGNWGSLGVPLDIKLGMLKQVSTSFEYRENVIVGYSLNDMTESSKVLYQLHSKNLLI